MATSMIKKICLDLAGPGMIFYSPFSVASILEGDDFLETVFSDALAVERQATDGRIVGVATGTSGRFIVEIYAGYPVEADVERSPYKLRLGIEVRDGILCIRDLFDFSKWNHVCPPDQEIALKDGYYHITLLSDDPPSGILGEDQVVQVYLQQLPEMPKLRYHGVPTLC